MKKSLLLISCITLLSVLNSVAQWQWTHCPANYTTLGTNGSTVFTGGPPLTMGVGLLRTTDAGGNWDPLNVPFVPCLAPDVWNPTTSGNGSYVLTQVIDGVNCIGTFRSEDNGDNWIPIGNGLTGQASQYYFAGGAIVYAATPDGVFLSNDTGSNWTTVDVGLGAFDQTALLFPDLVGTYGGGVYLDDMGVWGTVNNGLTNLNVTALAGISETDFFIATYGGGIFHSVNFSSTAVNNNLTDMDVFALIMDGGNLFAGTSAGGVFLSTDNGASWTAVNTGLTDLNVTALAIAGGDIYAATGSSGVAKRALSDILTSIPERNQNNTFSISPNPASDNLTYSIQQTFDKEIQISILNCLGESVFEKKENMSGNFSGEISLKNFESGVYFVKLRSGSSVYAEKVIIKQE